MEHGKFDSPGVRLHYVTAGDGPPLVLLHGYPQTWYEWREMIPRFANRFRVIAPDYRGAGDSGRPVDGYDKKTMSDDIRALVRHLVGDEPINLLGHDMGSFVAFSYAARFPDEVAKLVLVDAPLPGTALWDELVLSPALYHVAFHGTRDVPEMLVAGREREYIQQFFDVRAYLNEALTEDDLNVYVRSMQKPGALRAGFETYRAIPEDVRAHKEILARGKLQMPLFIVGAEGNGRGPQLLEMGKAIAENSSGVVIERSGHWVPEEQPDRFFNEVLAFL